MGFFRRHDHVYFYRRQRCHRFRGTRDARGGAGGGGAESDRDIGVSRAIKVLPIKIFPNAWQSVSIAAIFYALEMGARVINMSWGLRLNPISFAKSFIMPLIGLHPVAAAGNFSSSDPTYPASFPESFTVGATEPDGFMTFSQPMGHFSISLLPVAISCRCAPPGRSLRPRGSGRSDHRRPLYFG